MIQRKYHDLRPKRLVYILHYQYSNSWHGGWLAIAILLIVSHGKITSVAKGIL